MGLRELLARWGQTAANVAAGNGRGREELPSHAFWIGQLCEAFPELQAAAETAPKEQTRTELLQRLSVLVASASQVEDIGARLREFADDVDVDLPARTRHSSGDDWPTRGIPIDGQPQIDVYPCPAHLCPRPVVPQPGKTVCHIPSGKHAAGER